MTIKHTNRRGQIYYLYQGVTKTGKPKYFFSTKNNTDGLNVIPEDFEIYENPNAQVFLRKKESPLITELEKQTVISEINKNKSVQHYIVDVKKDYITIHTAKHEAAFEEPSWRAEFRQLINIAPSLVGLRYMPEMRFQLVEADERYFLAERFCYRGSVDDWIVISEANRLNKLAKQYLKHLGKDSFYELYPS